MNSNNKFYPVENLSKSGQTTINRPASKFMYSLGLYKGHFDIVTFGKNIILIILLIIALIWIAGILFLGWGFL